MKIILKVKMELQVPPAKLQEVLSRIEALHSLVPSSIDVEGEAIGGLGDNAELGP